MKKGQSHPASALSQKLLADGLLSLLEQKPFREITIKELCAHSDIARRTFYRHFSSVEDVMAYVVSHIIENFKKHMLQVQKEAYPAILASYFAFCKDYASLLELLNKNNLAHLIFIPYMQSLPGLPWLFPPGSFLDSFPDSFLRETPEGGEDMEVLNCRLSYHSGGLWSVLTYWCINGCSQPAEKLAQTLCGML